MAQRRTALMLVFVLLLALSANVFANYPKEVDDWLRVVGLGPYTPETEDWDAVYQKAKAEGKVTIYTSSSRTIQVKEEFESIYPGIEVEVYHLGTTESITKLHREQMSGIYNCDILHASGYPTQLNMLAVEHMIFPFVPPELKDVIPLDFREPLAAQRYEARGVFYNDIVYPEPPIESWWQLTLPEWRGKIAMVDPIVDASTLDFITTIVANADQLEEEYARFFGKPIKLTEENAGYQLLRGILDNGARLYNGHRDVGDLVGDPSLAQPPIGIGMVYSQMRYYGDESRGSLRHQPFLELKPAVGMLYPSLQNIAYKAPNPNAAKLMIKYLNGDDNGGLGLAPWFQEGNWPARQDIQAGHSHPVLGEINWKLDEINFWLMDPQAIWELQNDVQDWWMLNAY